MNTDKYLPLGTIVNIEGYNKEVMIIGYLCYSKDNNEIISADYAGIPVEEGYRKDNRILFNKEGITNIIFMGYKTEDTINKLKGLDETAEMIHNSKSPDEFFHELEKRVIKKDTGSSAINTSISTVLKEDKSDKRKEE